MIAPTDPPKYRYTICLRGWRSCRALGEAKELAEAQAALAPDNPDLQQLVRKLQRVSRALDVIPHPRPDEAEGCEMRMVAQPGQLLAWIVELDNEISREAEQNIRRSLSDAFRGMPWGQVPVIIVPPDIQLYPETSPRS